MSKIDARTLVSSGKARRLYVNVRVYNGVTYCDVQALWDTGAVSTHISDDVVTALALPSIGSADCISASEQYRTSLHKVNICVANLVTFSDITVRKLKPGIKNDDVILGMDIISQFDSAISISGGNTVFSIRYPSKGEIDFENEP